MPGPLIVIGVTYTSVTFSWTAPNMSNGIITQYDVEFKKTHGLLYDRLLPFGIGLEATITGLSPNTTYQFRVAAVTAVGRGPYTDVLNQATTCKSLYQMIQYIAGL